MQYTKFRDIPRLIESHYAVDYPLPYFVRWIAEEEKEEGLQLNPDFQRGHVWTEPQQIAYVEFLLRGGKSGRDFYFNYPEIRHQKQKSEYNDYQSALAKWEKQTGKQTEPDSIKAKLAAYQKQKKEQHHKVQNTLKKDKDAR